MTLVQLRYLVAIADAGLNITLAAERVHATQPGLSKQLRQLEDELGFKLFHRRGKSLHGVTAAGESVLERARTILAEAGNVLALAANLRNEAHGSLRIATTHTQARFALPDIVGAFTRRHPEVSVHLNPGREAGVLPQLSAGHVDIAVVSGSGGPPPAGIALPAYRWNRMLVVPKDHPFARYTRPPSLQELAAQPLVGYESSMQSDSSLQRTFVAAGLHPRIAMTAGDGDLIRTYVREGLGVGILAEMAVTPGDRDLVTLPADHLFDQCTTWIVLRDGLVPRDFLLDFIRGFAPHLDPRDIRRAVAGDSTSAWPAAPHWRQRGEHAA
ncbi:LysR family transcriptional regulator [Luteibacter rhizovicinus]|uniref:LysR family transcriptional regulator n=1 Tax=Luteibacter rhizovicinus TaxID=242606 RepID=A0A4R3YYJ4_9GAMM|nr:LysR substrate-binding domain-containing protein [Luteibacter rhizovicinus]TCV97686.1 LysR family transcriptional regulator [Luteibacter rhizovicinus]